MCDKCDLLEKENLQLKQIIMNITDGALGAAEIQFRVLSGVCTLELVSPCRAEAKAVAGGDTLSIMGLVERRYA